METPSAPSRRPRADAQRSIERIVATAGVVLRRDGPDAPLDRIAAEAGVGSATLHRHFPGRRALLVAVFEATVGALAGEAADHAATRPATEALWGWLDSIVRHCADDAGLAAALGALGRPEDRDPSWSPLADAGHPLLAAAKSAGGVRDDITIDDLLFFVDAAATREAGRPDAASKLLTILRTGASAT